MLSLKGAAGMLKHRGGGVWYACYAVSMMSFEVYASWRGVSPPIKEKEEEK
jgi:hypothetical protein